MVPDARSVTVDEQALQGLERAVALILADAETPVEAYRSTLETIGACLGWTVGAVWEVHGEVLRCAQTWHAGGGAPAFLAATEEIDLPLGVGLPGRVWASGEAAWLTDPPTATNFPRAAAARQEGLHAALGFPLRGAAGVVGVMEFFTRELLEPDARLLRSLEVLGSQIGQVVTRRRAEEQVHATASRLQAMLDAALDAVVTIDQNGVVQGWNRAAETIFGYSETEALGREMAELIVPTWLREAHRAGLARFVQGGEPVVLDRRIEITGLRADGGEFPVELAITRIALPGPPVFTGYLRDITDRKRAEEQLRASRARLVEVADAERRRIQRNLHDGAQQRLTSTLISLGRLKPWLGAGETPHELLDSSIDELTTALHELRELASGMLPPVLAERGLAEALRALALRAPVPVDLGEVPGERLPENVEAAAYYVVSEALANVHKHAHASRVAVQAGVRDGVLELEIADDGAGGASLDGGTGLLGLIDRVETLGGRLDVESGEAAGTLVRAHIPLSG